MKADEALQREIDVAQSKTVEIQGLAGPLVSRERGVQPRWIEFGLETKRRGFHVVVEDIEEFRREHGDALPPPEERWHVFITRRGSNRRQSGFLPLPKRDHPTMDAAIVAAIQGVLLYGDRSLRDWKTELTRSHGTQDDFAGDPEWESRIRSWMEVLESEQGGDE